MKVHCALFSAVLLCAAPAFADEDFGDDAATMPIGVTMKVVRIGTALAVPGSNANQPRDRTIFADGKGATVYTWSKDAPGTSACDAACAATWPPFIAVAGAKAVGDWSLITRADGAKQWAFRGKALYTNVKDGAAIRRAGSGETGGDEGARPLYSTSAVGHDIDGRQVVELKLGDWMELPTGINVQEVRTAPGQVLTTERGLTLYAFAGKIGSKIGNDWTPLEAPQLALPIGDFTVAQRGDGLTQWAWRGKPLYTFKGDLDYGDSNGKYGDSRFRIATVMRYFTPAGVAVRKSHAFGGLLTTAADHTLYVRENGIDGADGAQRAERGNPNIGMTIGVAACDAACERMWQPLIAPADAETIGYWTIFKRPDGRKQWGYYGYAMYTLAGEPPGQVNGHLIYDDVDNYELKADGTARPYLRLRWRVAPP